MFRRKQNFSAFCGILVTFCLINSAAAADFSATGRRRGGTPPRNTTHSSNQGSTSRPRTVPSSEETLASHGLEKYLKVLKRQPRSKDAANRLLMSLAGSGESLDSLLSALTEVQGKFDPTENGCVAALTLCSVAGDETHGELIQACEARYHQSGAVLLLRFERQSKKDPTLAFSQLDEALKHLKGEDLVEALRLLRGTAINEGKLEKAAEYQRQLVAGNGQSLFVRLEYPKLLANSPYETEAEREYQNLLRAVAGEAKSELAVRLDFIEFLSKHERWEETRTQLESALRSAPRNTKNSLFIIAGEAYRRDGHNKALIELLHNFRKEPEALHQIALAERSLGEFDQALLDWRELQKYPQFSDESSRTIIEILGQNGDINQLIAEYKKQIRSSKEPSRKTLDLIQEYVRWGRNAEANELLRSLELQPTSDPSIPTEVVQWLEQFSEEERLNQYLEFITKQEYVTPSMLQRQGELLWSTNQHSEAIATWKRIPRHSSNLSEGILSLITLLIQHEQSQEADSELQIYSKQLHDPNELSRLRALLAEQMLNLWGWTGSQSSYRVAHQETGRLRSPDDALLDIEKYWGEILRSSKATPSQKKEARRKLSSDWAIYRLNNAAQKFLADKNNLKIDLKDRYWLQNQSDLVFLSPQSLKPLEARFSDIISKYPNDLDFVMQLDELGAKLNDPMIRLKANRLEVEKSPPPALGARRRLIATLRLLDQTAEALEAAKALTVAAPRQADGWEIYAEYLAEEGNLKEATQALKAAYQISPSNISLGEKLSVYLGKTAQREEAILLLRELMRRSNDPNQWRSLVSQRAKLCKNLEEFTSLEADARLSFEANPEAQKHEAILEIYQNIARFGRISSDFKSWQRLFSQGDALLGQILMQASPDQKRRIDQSYLALSLRGNFQQALLSLNDKNITEEQRVAAAHIIWLGRDIGNNQNLIKQLLSAQFERKFDSNADGYIALWLSGAKDPQMLALANAPHVKDSATLSAGSYLIRAMAGQNWPIAESFNPKFNNPLTQSAALLSLLSHEPSLVPLSSDKLDYLDSLSDPLKQDSIEPRVTARAVLCRYQPTQRIETIWPTLFMDARELSLTLEVCLPSSRFSKAPLQEEHDTLEKDGFIDSEVTALIRFLRENSQSNPEINMKDWAAYIRSQLAELDQRQLEIWLNRFTISDQSITIGDLQIPLSELQLDDDNEAKFARHLVEHIINAVNAKQMKGALSWLFRTGDIRGQVPYRQLETYPGIEDFLVEAMLEHPESQLSEWWQNRVLNGELPKSVQANYLKAIAKRQQNCPAELLHYLSHTGSDAN